jgi:hypothetical protein
MNFIYAPLTRLITRRANSLGTRNLDHEYFLPGVPVSYIVDRLAKAGGNEVESGKLASPESSAALAVNTFGWFVERPECLPPFPGLESAFPAKLVDVEYCARFPWSGGRHPWLDAVVETETHLIGVESKRFEPFRDKKTVSLAATYDRAVWGDHMAPYERMRDALRSGAEAFKYLDCAQLVKHAFGLVTDGARKRKQPVLVYLFAEPALLHGKPIDLNDFTNHRAEISRFSNLVAGAAVKFNALSYRDWLETWPCSGPVAEHGAAVTGRFKP